MALLVAPGQPDSLVSVESRYGNFIGGEFVPPATGDHPAGTEPDAKMFEYDVERHVAAHGTEGARRGVATGIIEYDLF